MSSPGRRRYDRAPLGTGAGWKYQVSHWLAWALALVQAIGQLVEGMPR